MPDHDQLCCDDHHDHHDHHERGDGDDNDSINDNVYVDHNINDDDSKSLIWGHDAHDDQYHGDGDDDDVDNITDEGYADHNFVDDDIKLTSLSKLRSRTGW